MRLFPIGKPKAAARWGALCASLCLGIAGCGGPSDAPERDDQPGPAKTLLGADYLPPAPDGMRWELIWHDEFDGPHLDPHKWNIHPDGPRRDGFWSPEAVALDGRGCLVISTFKKGDRLLDGCVDTRGRFEHTFGYYVARIRLQRQPGHWSAFWLMGDAVGKVGDDGRDGTEIDIMEKPWLDHRVHHALHWDGYGDHHQNASRTVDVPGVMEGFHTFGLLWTPDGYAFDVDGHVTWRTRAGGVCRAPLYLMISDEIGPWAGDIRQADLFHHAGLIPNADRPDRPDRPGRADRFLVDYVRVYDLHKPGAGDPWASWPIGLTDDAEK